MPRRIQDRPEEVLQRAVAAFLDMALPDDAAWFHVPNQRGTRKRWENALLKALGVKAGVPDCCIVYRGRAAFIELKASGGGLSETQKAMQRRLTLAGAVVMTCHSLEEVEGVVGALMPLRGRVAA